jgi:Na+-driven multidrug efflux pump
MALIGYVVGAIATLAAPMGFHILFGTRYDASVPMFTVLIWGMLFVCLGVATSTVLTVSGRFWTSAVASLAGMVVNVGLNLWLIPRLGALGSAWATLVSYWVAAHGVFIVLPALHPTFAMLLRALLWPDIRQLKEPSRE